jgi:hypothetical protein
MGTQSRGARRRATASDIQGAGRLLRQLFAVLFRYHVGGVPICPVLVALPGSFFVLAVGRLRTPERAR